MKSVVSIVTCLAVITHFGVGCCAHHAHASCTAAHSISSLSHLEKTCQHGHKHSDGKHDSDRHSSPGHAPHGGCVEGNCSFILSSETNQTGHDLAGCLLLWVPSASSTAASSNVVQHVFLLHRSECLQAAPVYLLCQRLLI